MTLPCRRCSLVDGLEVEIRRLTNERDQARENEAKLRALCENAERHVRRMQAERDDARAEVTSLARELARIGDELERLQSCAVTITGGRVSIVPREEVADG